MGQDKDVEYQIKLQGSDGKNYQITYEGLWNRLQECRGHYDKLGWSRVTRSLRDDVNDLKELFLSEILIPQAKQAILTFLKEHPHVETRNFYDKKWCVQLRLVAWYDAKEQLEAEGKIISESHGRGKNRTWSIREV